jgi:hypothetical protein
MNVEERLDKIIEVYHAIPMDGSISMLTGSNGSGKSFIRGQLLFRDEMDNGKDKKRKTLAHCSMSMRTQNRGMADAFTHDTDWNPTSLNTIHFINCASNSIYGGYLVLDEIEVGCSEETQMGIVDWLNKNLRERIKDTLGCLVITHSRYVVANLNFDNWFNLDGYKTKEDWLNRKIVAVDTEELQKTSHELFQKINSLKPKK